MTRTLFSIAFLFLFVVTLSQCNFQPQLAIVQIVQIVDETNNAPINQVDISISSGEIPGRDKDDLYAWDLEYPINIPVKVGKCSYIRIEAEGYNVWDQTFCPKEKGLVDVELTLSPEISPDTPTVKPVKILPTVEYDT